MKVKRYKVIHLLSYPIALLISHLLYFLCYLGNNILLIHLQIHVFPTINTDIATLSLVIAINFYAYSCRSE